MAHWTELYKPSPAATNEVVELAEECLLGAILTASRGSNRDPIEHVRSLVTADDFKDNFYKYPENQRSRIYAAMLKCEYPYQLAVAETMHMTGTLRSEVVSGMIYSDISYMSHMMERCPCSLDYPYYAKVVHEFGMKRKIAYFTQRNQLDKVQELLNKQNRPVFSGGIIL